MPKCIVFVACDKIVVDETDHTSSVLSITEIINVETQALTGMALPEDAVIPFQWSMLALLYRLPEDEGKEFDVRISAMMPNGIEPEGTTLPESIRLTERLHRLVMRFTNLRISQGEQVMKLYVREVGQDTWQLIAEFPVLVNITFLEPEEPAPSN